MADKTGGCLCGGVRFSARGIETHHHACHCGMCRRWSGGPVLAAEVDGLTFDGVDNLARYESSDWAERGFCRNCGSSLFYHLKPQGLYMVCVGAFDDPTGFQLTSEIFIDHKPAGYAFAGDHPRLTEAETLARFAPSETPATSGRADGSSPDASLSQSDLQP